MAVASIHTMRSQFVVITTPTAHCIISHVLKSSHTQHSSSVIFHRWNLKKNRTKSECRSSYSICVILVRTLAFSLIPLVRLKTWIQFWKLRHLEKYPKQRSSNKFYSNVLSCSIEEVTKTSNRKGNIAWCSKAPSRIRRCEHIIHWLSRDYANSLAYDI